MELIKQINDTVNGFVWGVPAMVCIIGVRMAELPHRIHPDTEIRLRPEDDHWQDVSQERGRGRRCHTISGGLHRTGGNCRDRKYCRSCRSDRAGRPGAVFGCG